MARPRLIVIVGPPGSGKMRYFPVTAFRVDSFNIDDRCAQILGSYRAIPRPLRADAHDGVRYWTRILGATAVVLSGIIGFSSGRPRESLPSGRERE